MKIVVIGSTGRVGSNLLRSALEKGHEVLAIARHPENIKVQHDNLQIKNVNIFDENTLAEELQGKDALVSCLGGQWSLFNRKPVTIYTDSVKVFSGALRKSGVSRMVIMSGWPIADDVVPLWAKPLVALTFKNLIQNMRDMEAYLQENCTDIDYTAVKMPTGTAQEESGKPISAHEGQSVPGGRGYITYGDVSKFVLENCLRDGEWKKKLVSICGS